MFVDPPVLTCNAYTFDRNTKQQRRTADQSRAVVYDKASASTSQHACVVLVSVTSLTGARSMTQLACRSVLLLLLQSRQSTVSTRIGLSLDQSDEQNYAVDKHLKPLSH